MNIVATLRRRALLLCHFISYKLTESCFIITFSILVLVMFAGIHSLNWRYLFLMDRSIIEQLPPLQEKGRRNASESSKPNIIFILADDFGWNDIGYHSSSIRTPNLDRLAGDGVKLENYYVQPICSPSRSQLMTGRYQIHFGLQHSVIMNDRPHGLPLDEVILPEVLKECGYSTHIIGKWHLGFFRDEYTPTRRGFDTFFGFLGGGEDYWTHRIPNEKVGSPTTYRALDLWDQLSPVRNQNGIYSTHLFAKKSVEIISRHDRDKPMFLYLPFQAVHAPLEAPEEYISQYKHIKRKGMRIYSAVATAMDEAVGNVTRALKDYGLWENSVLIFSTDNGASRAGSNWPLRGFKNTLWEGGVRGVGFVSSPLLRRKGTTSEALVHISDWFPTITNLAGGSNVGTKALDGYDVWDAISEGKESPREEILHNIDPLITARKSPTSMTYRDVSFDPSVRAAIRSGDWKLITGNPGPGDWLIPSVDGNSIEKSASTTGQHIWLFNIRKDPQERNDLSTEHPQIVNRLLGRLADYNKTAVSPFWPDIDGRSDPVLHGDLIAPWLNVDYSLMNSTLK